MKINCNYGQGEVDYSRRAIWPNYIRRSTSIIGMPVTTIYTRTEYLIYLALFSSFSLPGLRIRAIKMKTIKVKVIAVR